MSAGFCQPRFMSTIGPASEAAEERAGAMVSLQPGDIASRLQPLKTCVLYNYMHQSRDFGSFFPQKMHSNNKCHSNDVNVNVMFFTMQISARWTRTRLTDARSQATSALKVLPGQRRCLSLGAQGLRVWRNRTTLEIVESVWISDNHI